MVPMLAIGGKLVLMRKWDPEMAMQLIERERITGAGGVPTIAWQLIEHPALGKYDLSSLENFSYGGAPAAAELVRRVKEKFPRAVPGTGWGMTEVSGAFTGNQAEDYLLRPDSCGPAIPVGDMKIADTDGDALPPGSVGELWVKGPNVVRGYWRNPKATAETFVDGWLRTGDIARLDDEGFCYILDRAKDMLIRGGENIYCIEVESALYEHPAVIDAAVVGGPASHAGRRTRRGGHAERGDGRERRRAARLCCRAACRVQGAGKNRVLGRDAAAQCHRQSAQERAQASIRRK